MWNGRALVSLFALTVVLALVRDRRTTEQGALAAYRGQLQHATAEDTFSGTTIVAKRGAPIFEAAFNRADRERRIPNAMTTSFNIGSITKMYTAVVVLRLVQDGKLALTDPVGRWIPDYPNREIRERVTIHHLLTHTGGAGDIFDEHWLEDRLSLRTHDDYLAKLGARAPRFAPGTQWEYANYGYVLAGAIIERVTGMTYWEAVQRMVFDPAGMKHSAFPRHDEDVGAVGYTDLSGARRDNRFVLMYRGIAAGCAWSSAEDLLAFANALTANRLLDAKHTQLMLSPMVRTRQGFTYGYGVAGYDIDGVRCVGHGGGFPGANAELVICESGYTIITLANLDPPAASRMAHYVAVRLPAR